MVVPKIGIIGGSGLENAEFVTITEEKEVSTPFGRPSDLLRIGTVDGIVCVFLSRHDRQHRISPSGINYRANIWALHQEGCTHLLVTTACGSLREEIVPGDPVFLDQFIDRTNRRETTFFTWTPGGPKGVCHIPMHAPSTFCERTRQIMIASAKELGIRHHEKGTTVTIEGPRFSTRAESDLYRSWGAHIVNMTTVPEANLAKELGICYAAIALPTDYDCWRDEPGHEHVSAELVLKTFQDNVHKAEAIIRKTVSRIVAEEWTDYIGKFKEIAKSAVMLDNASEQVQYL